MIIVQVKMNNGISIKLMINLLLYFFCWVLKDANLCFRSYIQRYALPTMNTALPFFIHRPADRIFITALGGWVSS